MAQYRKKPVVIEAVRIVGAMNVKPLTSFPIWLQQAVREGSVHLFNDGLEVHTLEGNMLGDVGDWLIQGVKGELYPCKPDIFAATYEAVSA